MFNWFGSAELQSGVLQKGETMIFRQFMGKGTVFEKEW